VLLETSILIMREREKGYSITWMLIGQTIRKLKGHSQGISLSCQGMLLAGNVESKKWFPCQLQAECVALCEITRDVIGMTKSLNVLELSDFLSKPANFHDNQGAI